MSLVVKNTRDIPEPSKFKFKVLIYGLPGAGKTSWMCSAPDLGVAACETGQGKGLLSVVRDGVEYVEPSNTGELEAFCNGAVFKNKQTLGLDSLSWMNKSFIRETALAIPRKQEASGKRAQGVPEIDDYQVMAEISRRILAKLLEKDQHLVVTATEKEMTNDADGTSLYVPDLPGALALTCTAMFDFVFRIRTRQAFRDRKDPSTRYVERYLITASDGVSTLAKCRSNDWGVPLLPREVIFDIKTKEGGFVDLLRRIVGEYEKGQKEKAPQAVVG